MFRKLKAGLGSKSSKSKFRLDVAVTRVEGLPPGVAACRLQWARGAKVAVTKLVPAADGAVEWNEELSQIATLVRTPSGGYEEKAYEFKLQAPDPSHPSKPPATVGKAALDMARFAPAPGGPPRVQQVALTVPLGGGSATLHLLVGATEVKGMGPDDDAMSVMTGASGLSSVMHSTEQDLSGFRMDSSRDLGHAARHTPADSAHPPSATAPAPAAAAPAAAPLTASAALEASRRSSEAPSIATISEAQPSSSVGGEVGDSAVLLLRTQAELEAAKEAVAERDERVRRLQQELAEAHQDLAARQAPAPAAPAPAAADSDAGEALAVLRAQNADLVGEAEALRSQLIASAAAAAASASAAGGAAAESSALQEQLAVAQARVGQLEGELEQAAAAAQAAGSASAAASSGGDDATATAAKLAIAERKIQQLAALVQQGAASGEDGARVAELQAALEAAEHDVAEAEAMAQEAMEMAEGARDELAAVQGEKERLEAEAAELRAEAEEAQGSVRWREEREAKKEAEWDARLKEAYKRMEESLSLAERMQRDKDGLEERCSVLLSEKQAIEAKLDPNAVDQQVALEVEAARRAAEAQARVEVEALQQRLRAMEEYVEEADSKRLASASRVSELEAALAVTKRGEEDTYGQIQAAEERAEGLSLELQYAQGEAARLAAELELAREAAERRAREHQRSVAEVGARCEALTVGLEAARGEARQEAAVAGELRSRVMLLQEDLEGAKLASAAAAAAGVGVGAAAAGGADAAARARLEREVAERQRAAEERAAQLEAMGRELGAVRASLDEAQAAREAAEAALAEARRSAASAAAQAAEVEAALAAKEAQLSAAQEAQRSSLALMSARGRGSTMGEEEGEARSLREELAAEQGARAAEVAGLTSQLAEAQSLAAYSGGEMAGLVQALAEARGDAQEAAAKLAEAREEVSRLRSGPDGELRARIERLEKELVIQRNRAEVNALFKEEHDRIAQDLVETKLVWAEAQEAIVKLKRSLVKSQEKNVNFSAKLTKMETKMYATFNGTAESMQKGAKKLGSKLSMKRGSSRDPEGGAAGGQSAGSELPSPVPSAEP
ncbi:hypothetical protein C2E20_8974 [Micractinium conductrix]|uniref:C2 NT-type domain-containing protein n=1 Tax=Micractinium conductrix TaxID=554055 RepID=A0A2P6UZR7_9CHLO|nr:hypothetical protein C2E20_8974 [Micractinium conductrix]|eukprot:PSC67340.1 hypothetical protein C2E20_8974 [Micractinium conductrix]